MASTDKRPYKSDFRMPFVGPANPHLTQGEGKPLNVLRKTLMEYETGRDLAWTVGGELELMPFYPTWQDSDSEQEDDDSSESHSGYRDVATTMTPEIDCQRQGLRDSHSKTSLEVASRADEESPTPDTLNQDQLQEVAQRALSLAIRTKSPSDESSPVRPTLGGKFPALRPARLSFHPSSRPSNPFLSDSVPDAAPSTPTHRASSNNVPDSSPPPSGFTTTSDAFPSSGARFLSSPLSSRGPLGFPPVAPGRSDGTVTPTTATITSATVSNAVTNLPKDKVKTKKRRNMCMPRRPDVSNFDTAQPEEFGGETGITLRWDARPRAEPVASTTTRLDFPPNALSGGNIQSLLSDMRPTEFGYELAPNFFSTNFSPHESGIVDLIAQSLLPTWPTPDDYVCPKPEGRSVEVYLQNLQVHCSQEVLNADPQYRDLRARGKLRSTTTTATGQFGQLIVVLPFKYFAGGKLIIRPPEPRTFDVGAIEAGLEDPVEHDHWNHPHKRGTRAPKIFWAAFHRECEYRVTPVRSGYRVSLVYNLFRVRGNPLMGSSLTARTLLDTTKIPMYRPLVDLLSDELAWGVKGGYLGFMLVHSYPHGSRSGDEIGFHPEMSLRGVDFLMYQMVLHAFKKDGRGDPVPIDIQIRPVARWVKYEKKYGKKHEVELTVADTLRRMRIGEKGRRGPEEQNQQQQQSRTNFHADTEAATAGWSNPEDQGKGKEKENSKSESPVKKAYMTAKKRKLGPATATELTEHVEVPVGGRVQAQGQAQTTQTVNQALVGKGKDSVTAPTPVQAVQVEHDAEENLPRPIIGKNFSRAGLHHYPVSTNDPDVLVPFFDNWAGKYSSEAPTFKQPQEHDDRIVGTLPCEKKKRDPGYYIDFDDVHWLNRWGHEEPSLINIEYTHKGPNPRVVKTCLAMIIRVPPGGINASHETRMAYWPERFRPEGDNIEGTELIMESIEYDD